jgi:hypothetical protein
MGEAKQARIPFGNLQASGLEELGGGSPVAMNVVADSLGVIRKRPGMSLYLTSVVDSEGVSALYETVAGDVYAVAGVTPQRNIYWIKPTGAVNLSTGPASDVRGTRRPVIAETESILVFAGGDYPEKLLLDTRVPSPLGGSPPDGSHAVANGDRLLINEVVAPTRSGFNYSAQAAGTSFAGFETWTGATSEVAGFISVDGRPDPVIALHENTAEVFAFGSTSLQVFAQDGSVFVYGPVVTRELGCAAAYSIVKHDQTFMWLDHLRRFVQSDGRNQDILSDPIQKTLDTMSSVADCFGYRVKLGYIDAVIWTFPTDGRTFVYQKGAGWGEWSGWDGTHWTPFPVTAKTVIASQAKVLVGTSDGHVGTLDLAATQDFGSDINAYIITGFQSHDTENPKSCNRLTVTLRRGQVSSATEPVLLLSWRDDPGPWEPSIPLSLGAAGDYYPVVQLWGLGTYRRRQWKLEFTDAADLALVAAVEEFEVLGG